MNDRRRNSSRDEQGRIPYWLTYGLTAGLLLAITAALVLIVLPSRYALVADLRESGFSFPTSADAVAFPMPQRDTLIAPPPPAPAPVVPEPGPAERLWAGVDSLLALRDYRGAIARMEDYLEAHPEDLDVARERARTLANAGRPAAARAAYEDLVRRAGAPSDRLALARLLRDAGEVDAAVGLYRDLLAARPDDLELRHELAELYLWAERYDEAETELRRLVAAAPGNGRYRLDLARALYWNDRPEEARTVLAAMPAGAPEAAEAAELDRELARVLTPPPEPEPEPPTLVERAREAAAADSFAAALDLYDRAVAEASSDTALARERIDFIQFRMEDQAAAIAALEAYRDRFGLDADGRYRLAQLYVWTEQEAAARRELEALVRDYPERADAWGLLGDVHRYADRRSAARDAYERALALQADEVHATAGIAELDRLRAETIAAREPVGAGPNLSLFSDSDDFLRLDLGGGAGWTGSQFALDLTAGYRRLEGHDLGGLAAEDDGGFARLEAARWWSEASLRTALSLGADYLRDAGTEPRLGASVARFSPDGGSVSLEYEHSAAFPLTYTLESAIADVAADRLGVATYQPLGGAWSLSAAGDLVWLSGAGPTNQRWSAAATVAHSLGPWLAADVGTRVLGFSDPAPAPGRRLYWDPKLFWSNTAGLTVGRRVERGLGVRLRLSGGAAWADERDTAAGWIPQYAAEAGLTWRAEDVDLDVDAFYRRSRENEYNSLGAALTLRIRP
ncbi:MAG: tetratricopeptide repeat protein [Gemmatimonadales bacterium]|jgi:predicted Zn-dependent protease